MLKNSTSWFVLNVKNFETKLQKRSKKKTRTKKELSVHDKYGKIEKAWRKCGLKIMYS